MADLLADAAAVRSLSTCGFCHSSEDGLKVCACHRRSYCDVTCQHAHWPVHRLECRNTRDLDELRPLSEASSADSVQRLRSLVEGDGEIPVVPVVAINTESDHFRKLETDGNCICKWLWGSGPCLYADDIRGDICSRFGGKAFGEWPAAEIEILRDRDDIGRVAPSSLPRYFNSSNVFQDGENIRHTIDALYLHARGLPEVIFLTAPGEIPIPVNCWTCVPLVVTLLYACGVTMTRVMVIFEGGIICVLPDFNFPVVCSLMPYKVSELPLASAADLADVLEALA